MLLKFFIESFSHDREIASFKNQLALSERRVQLYQSATYDGLKVNENLLREIDFLKDGTRFYNSSEKEYLICSQDLEDRIEQEKRR